MYISSVRFERRRFGVLEAMEYFWDKVERNPTNAQAFFLIERVSNIRSKLLVNKIVETVRSAKEAGLLSADDIQRLVDIYTEAVASGKITATQTELLKFSEGVNS
ncbi:hypothetical protein R50073_36760 [Maricurvus nonylphenolicus]